jgi:lysyl-tRNA synthetase, class II
MPLEDIKKAREDKLANLQKNGVNPYPPNNLRTHAIREALDIFDELHSAGAEITLVGRLRLKREHGGSAFFNFEDGSAGIQGYAKKDVLGEVEYAKFLELYDIGDFIEATGKFFLTHRGEKTLQVKSLRMLSKSLMPLPEKWHGLSDTEERFRRRYLDLVMNPEVRGRFESRSRIIQSFRNYFAGAGFLEVETPILQTLAGGALAKPFKTRLETLSLDLYMRVAPELYLKRLLVGGFEKVFEIGRCFRNEGMDKDHNPEFTMLEAYAAYRDYEWLMAFTENLFSTVLAENCPASPIVKFEGQDIDFTPPWPRKDLNEAVKEATGLDFWGNSDEDYLAKAKELGITVEKKPTKIALFDEMFKKVARPKMMNPVFVVNHPLEISPLAKTHRGDPRKVERFQLVVGGMEIANAFSELNDPAEQRRRFEAQENERAKGDEESHRFDEDFVEALEYGMPPAAGIGIGIDRVVRILTNGASLREVLLFPTMKPK